MLVCIPYVVLVYDSYIHVVLSYIISCPFCWWCPKIVISGFRHCLKVVYILYTLFCIQLTYLLFVVIMYGLLCI